MTSGQSSERLIYRVEMVVPGTALSVRDKLDWELHQSDRHIGVITGEHGRGLKLAVLCGAEDAEGAQEHALRLVTGALDNLGLGELTSAIDVVEVVGRPVLAGGPRLVDALPPLDYRAAAAPGGRVVHAACSGPLGEWFAYTDDEPNRVMAGRSLPEVLDELFELPWGRKEPWFDIAIEQLAGQPTTEGVRYPCPCCGYLTLERPPPGTYAICGVCFWEDDRIQFRDPDYTGGANTPSLRQARENYRVHGASELRARSYVRPPLPLEQP